MRELADAVEPEHARETLERVGRAEDAVHEIGVDLTAATALVAEIGEVLSHALEDLLGLGDELAMRLAAASASSATFLGDLAAFLAGVVVAFAFERRAATAISSWPWRPASRSRTTCRSASGSKGFTR